MEVRRAAALVCLVALALPVSAAEPDATAHAIVLAERLAEAQKENAQLRLLLGWYQQTLHALVTKPFDEQIAKARAERARFEQAHPAPSGQRWDWTRPVPALVPVEAK